MMNMNGKVIAIVLLLLSGLLTAQVHEYKHTFQVGKGGTIKLNLPYCEFVVKPSDRNDVVIGVVGPEDDEEFEKIKFTVNGNVISLKSGWATSTIEILTLYIPKQFNLELSTAGGDVTITDNMSGSVKVHTAGGDISFRNITGQVKASTSGGDITLGTIKGDGYLSSAGGEFRIDEISGNAEINTAGGDITIKKIGKNLTVSTAGGNITVNSVGEELEANTGGGDIYIGYVGKSASMNSGGGSITIKQGKGDIEVTTGSGDIFLNEIFGNIKATTGFGNIEVGINPDEKGKSSILTSNGDIILNILPGTKAHITAEVYAQGWWKESSDIDEYIKSDYQPDTVNKEGSPRKIKAMYTINGGGAQIKLKTTSGTIRIKRVGK